MLSFFCGVVYEIQWQYVWGICHLLILKPFACCHSLFVWVSVSIFGIHWVHSDEAFLWLFHEEHVYEIWGKSCASGSFMNFFVNKLCKLVSDKWRSATMVFIKTGCTVISKLMFLLHLIFSHTKIVSQHGLHIWWDFREDYLFLKILWLV